MGAPSRGLIDVDLDHVVAVNLSASYLPMTGSVFGRAGKRRSHWLYYAGSAVSTRQWRLPDDNKRMVVELRSTGGQTVFPGSVHPSGQAIEWERDGEPSTVDPAMLQEGLQRLFDEICRRLGVRQHTEVAPPNPHVSAIPPSVVERATKYLAKLPPAISGHGGHDATFHAACTLVLGFGLDRDGALSVIRTWNELCQPPWSERELEHKVDDALKQPGWRGYLLVRPERRSVVAIPRAIERANRHAIEHRRRSRRRAHA